MVMLANDRKDFSFKMQLLSYPNVDLGYVAEDVMVGAAPDPGFSLDVEGSDPAQVKAGIDFLVEGLQNYLVH